jgi:hypothetical protein
VASFPVAGLLLAAPVLAESVPPNSLTGPQPRKHGIQAMAKNANAPWTEKSLQDTMLLLGFYRSMISSWKMPCKLFSDESK